MDRQACQQPEPQSQERPLILSSLLGHSLAKISTVGQGACGRNCVAVGQDLLIAMRPMYFGGVGKLPITSRDPARLFSIITVFLCGDHVEDEALDTASRGHWLPTREDDGSET